MFSQLPTNADREAYELVKSAPPTPAAFPNTFAWFVLVHRFSDSARASWTGPQAAPAKGGEKKAAAAAPAKKEETVKAEVPKPAAKADDDEMDLFGDDDEDDEVSFLFNRYLIIITNLGC